MSVSVESGAAGPAGTPRATMLLRVPLVVLILLVAWLVVMFLMSLHLTLRHVEATMHTTVAVRGLTVQITGTTDLPDGAVIGYYFVHELGPLQGQEPDGGLTTVRNGRFDFQTDFTGWPGGAIALFTEFGVGSGYDQPQGVIDLFGADGEGISGPQAYSESGDPPHLFATTTFVLPSQ